jgi:hypothetical protein
MSFKKLPQSILSENDQTIFERAHEHIAAQVGEKSGEINRSRFNKIPDKAKAIYWLWRFQCEAGVCGIDVFVLEPLGIYAPETHAALVMVGAVELARRLEAAIALARKGSAEFKRLQDQSWFNQFKPLPEFPTWESLLRSTFALTKSSLTDLTIRFTKKHKIVLFEKS